MTKTRVDLQALLDICAAEMTELGLSFNAKKTKAVPFAGNMAEAADLKLGALGFAGEDGVNNPQAVKETMRRLERWRAVVVSQRAKALGGAVTV
ncbi:hypothetical protein MRX96_037989 [Rhipicephalus microplus]